MVTLKDLAQQLNLSPSTVSRALAGKYGVSEATIKRARALATQLHYQPNESAVSLRRGQTRMLGVILPHLNNNFFARIMTGIEEVASRAGSRVLICQSADDAEHERQNLDMLLQAQVDGVLLSVARTTQQAQHIDHVRNQVPLVFFDRHLDGDPGHAVVIDDRVGSYLATQHLLAQGYRRIAHVGGPQHISIYHHRRLGYEDALREAGLVPEPELLLTCDLRLADGAAAAQSLLSATFRPDAIFAASDFAALGAMQTLKQAGIRIPQDMGLIGFSNELFSEYTEPALTTIDQHGEDLGRQAARLLLQLLKSKTAPGTAEKNVLKPTLLIRASSVRWPASARHAQ